MSVFAVRSHQRQLIGVYCFVSVELISGGDHGRPSSKLTNRDANDARDITFGL